MKSGCKGCRVGSTRTGVIDEEGSGCWAGAVGDGIRYSFSGLAGHKVKEGRSNVAG